MASAPVSGTEGYAEEAEALVEQYESIRFDDVHRQVLHLIPTVPSRVLDIGAGTGRDAAGFAAMGHHVVAVEPTAALRTKAAALHPSPKIQWLDDSLPELASVVRRGEIFDVVMLYRRVDAPRRTSTPACHAERCKCGRNERRDDPFAPSRASAAGQAHV